MRHGEDLRVARYHGRNAPRVHDKRMRLAVGEHPVPRRQAAARIEDHADGIRALDVPDRELRVIARDGSGADDHGIAQCAQPVEMAHVLGAGDVVGVAGAGRNVSVETLPQVPDRQRSIWRRHA